MCSNPPRFLNSIKIYVLIKKTNWNTTISSFFVSKHSLSSVNSIWSSARSHLPKTIYDFTIRQINNSLPAYKIWRGLSQNPDCFFCFNPETLLHIVAGCQDYLDRVTWGQDSIFNVIANSLQPVINDGCKWFSKSFNYNWWKLSSFPNTHVQVPICSRTNSSFPV